LPLGLGHRVCWHCRHATATSGAGTGIWLCVALVARFCPPRVCPAQLGPAARLRLVQHDAAPARPKTLLQFAAEPLSLIRATAVRRVTKRKCGQRRTAAHRTRIVQPSARRVSSIPSLICDAAAWVVTSACARPWRSSQVDISSSRLSVTAAAATADAMLVLLPLPPPPPPPPLQNE
jgi:hypothetical protein